MVISKVKTKKYIEVQKKYNKCYKKYCNKIITKKQLTKKLVKQFDNFEKSKNNINEKRKNLSLIIKSDKCSDKYCHQYKIKSMHGGNKNKKTKQQLDIYQK